ncbi:hypothetical protein CC85DRAFT_325599 [Cutaneotrichosporon oleaginosum]|uniref:GAR domain-containing protein n=1 Tax=Cutaneotrichosporon oleaginosum TaxID=879819 RepID=A0A0J0XWP3_9TREE|nr:uncharacterized protein CC85DRAFT_325599 [Cutaneotrichosporon oleaginosum]KLT45471.1 hypothetical protein CC85DRAFT_325599 [Cutaneotrichosporon oleaginosum]TXT14573.1 hypothetical protein COLE_00766 [Cutaneotrichosporon oleaginosum]
MNGESSTTKPRRQDLSYADQQELLAFIEKRRWFEGKLESLKALAPVYPFVHPVLVPDPASTAGYVRAGAESSPWRLPNKAQLAAWVNERKALVDEVERFDDGDMERMKEKTRQITRVPLTQPSTDLVEVTLDLILLIDQLLAVLRNRGSILELTSLRLQWDDLRYEVRRETESVTAEIEHVVAEAQAWLPGAPTAPRWEPRRRRSSAQLPPSPSIRPSLSEQSLPEHAVAPSTPPLGAKQILRSPNRTPSPTKLPGSPTKPHNVPRSALHISILRSQLVGLQTRHHNLQYSLVRRSGQILDKMIDQAGKLKDLGGVDGPLDEDGQRQHAIPDALIDLQEEIEARATDIGDRVKWCSSFEQQCRKGHDHYSRSARAGKAGLDFLSDIKAALCRPPTSQKHLELQQMFAEASSALPPPLDAEPLPMPTHPAFPSKDDHNEAVVAALNEARSDAEVDLDLGDKLLAYYGQLLRAREALQAQHARVQVLREHLNQAIRQLDVGSSTAPRPTLDGVASDGGDHSEWLSNISSWTSEGDMASRAATDAHETTILAIMQYRKALSSASMAVRPHLPPDGVPDDLGPLVDDDSQDLVALGMRCAALAKRARSDADIIPIVLSIRKANADISEDLTTLHANVVGAINLAAWSPRSNSALPTTLSDELTVIEERVNKRDSDLDRLRAVPLSSDAIPPLESAAEDSKENMAEALRALDVFRRVSAQAQTVRDLQDEANRLVEQLELASESLADANPDSSDTILADLRGRVTEWNDNIISRVGLVSGHEPSSSTWSPDGERRSTSGPLTPPLTPVDRVDESSGLMSTMPDLMELDRRVRSEVNHQSARVMASLAHLTGVHDRLSYERWAAPVRCATESLDAAKDELQTTLSRLMQELGHMNDDNQASRHEHAVESIRTGAEAIGKHASTVQSLVARLNDVLGADASAGIDMRQAADIFSSADVTREAALEQITKAEKWQRQLEDIVTQSLLARSATPVARRSVDVPRTPEQVAKKAKSLSGGLDALDLEAIVHPSPAQLRATPKRRRLPSSSEAKQLAKAFTSIADKARSMARAQPDSPELKKLLDKVASQGSLVPDLAGLADVSDAAAVCDDAFSRLLDTVDAGAERETRRQAEKEAKAAVETLQHVSKPLLSDSRVALEKRRIFNTWLELRAVAEEDSTAGSSTTGSSANVSERRAKPRLAPHPATRRMRTNSMFTAGPERGTPTPSRVLSDTSQARVRRTRPSLDNVPFSPKTPTRQRNSLPSSISMPGRPTPRAITPTVPVPFKLSTSRSISRVSRSASSSTNLAGLAETPTRSRTRFASEPPISASGRKPKFMPAREKSTLDAAVQNVLKELDMKVPIVPAGRLSPDEWKGESGRYWIGHGARARMCFCRILESKTVMVRVGGGWCELTRYLLSHFADEIEATSSLPEWNTTPVTVTSASLKNAPASLTSLQPSTPSRASLPAQFTPEHATTPLPLRAASLSPEKSPGPGSPLVPFQYLRKASESPSVRDKERAALRRNLESARGK